MRPFENAIGAYAETKARNVSTYGQARSALLLTAVMLDIV
jgi:hypothetical protein